MVKIDFDADAHSAGNKQIMFHIICRTGKHVKYKLHPPGQISSTNSFFYIRFYEDAIEWLTLTNTLIRLVAFLAIL